MPREYLFKYFILSCCGRSDLKSAQNGRRQTFKVLVSVVLFLKLNKKKQPQEIGPLFTRLNRTLFSVQILEIYFF